MLLLADTGKPGGPARPWAKWKCVLLIPWRTRKNGEAKQPPEVRIGWLVMELEYGSIQWVAYLLPLKQAMTTELIHCTSHILTPLTLPWARVVKLLSSCYRWGLGLLLDCKEIQSVHPKGNQSWMFIGRTDVVAETPILWPPDANGGLIWRDPDARKDWRREEKGMTEEEMVGWHHRLNGHEFG